MMKEKCGIVNLNNSDLFAEGVRMVGKCTLLKQKCPPDLSDTLAGRVAGLQPAIFQHRLDLRIVAAPVAVQRLEIAAVAARQNRLAETLAIFAG